MAQLLDAAAAVIADTGYDAATMCAIAERAAAPIGSLYQFFPNKTAVAHALRVRFGSDYEGLLIALEEEASGLSLERLVARLLNMTVRFVDGHPAFLALLDAPASTRSPASLRNTLRIRLACCLSAVRPGIQKKKALRLATVTLQMLRGLNQLYGEVSTAEWKRVVEEYTVAISAYLKKQTGKAQKERAGA
ncbi:MAG TPA: TetR/AcrR family transcriptional regulator [Bryobacteraceae bacterium]|nr:TetR/AcrR family transcriptional regulator [Bryobacteraceae bacterium]